MKELFQEFGAAVIALITAVFLFAIMFGISFFGRTGILHILGKSVEKQEVDYVSYRDFDAVAVWHDRRKPEVHYQTELGRFFSNEAVNFLERYYAKDMERIIYPMNEVILSQRFQESMFGSICDIRDKNGNSVLAGYDAYTGKMRFPVAGIYEVYFRVIDKENVEATWKIPIAVDEGR